MTFAFLRDDQSAINTQLYQLRANYVDLKTALTDKVTDVRRDLLDSIRDSGPSTDLSQSEISQQLQDFQALVKTIPLQYQILRQLLSEEMNSRKNHILEADADTCRWLLDGDFKDLEDCPDTGSTSDDSSVREETYDEARRRKETHMEFITWLTTGRGVLHISGNAGSGKSTLMKFIGSHERTKRELEAWAGTKTLVFGQFYFWSAGTSAQRTLLGLYRSLLYQVVAQCPDLIEDIFPSQASRMTSSTCQYQDPAVERVQAFGDEHIREAFDLLLRKTQSLSHRLFFLIDGLDEFEGNRLDHEELATKLKGWAAGEDVKLLVSSRPWQEFSKIFTKNPPIHLHELNGFDIKKYCLIELQGDEEVCQQDLGQKGSLIPKVVDKITTLSQGIFLWAHIVLDAIRHGVRQGDSEEILMRKLEEYPSDLDDLYSELREPIKKSAFDTNTSNQMLLLALKVPEDFDLYAVAFSWLNEDELLNPEFPVADKCQPYTEDEIAKRLECARRRVNVLTRGLLEVFTDWNEIRDPPRKENFASLKVRYCHKSARDYLIQRSAELQASWPDFDQVDVYGRMHLASHVYGFDTNAQSRTGQMLAPAFCRIFDINTIRKFEAPLGPWLYPSDRYLDAESQLDSKLKYCDPRNRVSFMQYAAYCGLGYYVLSVLDTDQPRHIHSPGSNLLLALVSNNLPDKKTYFAKVCSALFERGVADLGRMVNTTLGGQVLALPTWVLAMTEIVSWILYFMDADGLAARVELARRLHEYGIHVGQSLSMTLEGKRNTTKRTHDRSPVLRISSGEVVRYLELVAAGESDQSKLAVSASLKALFRSLSKSVRPTRWKVIALKWQSQHVDMCTWFSMKTGVSEDYRSWRRY